MTGPWVLRLACMRDVLDYLLPSEQIAYCQALMLSGPKDIVVKQGKKKWHEINGIKHGVSKPTDIMTIMTNNSIAAHRQTSPTIQYYNNASQVCTASHLLPIGRNK